MKFKLKNILAGVAIALAFYSCSSDSDTPVVNELAELTKIKEITNATHTIELYSRTGALEQGYNNISLRIKDKVSGDYVKNATVNWMPLMHMATKTHSCPKSGVEKITTDGTLYKGNIVFQMAQNASEYWDLKIDYTINGAAFTVTSIIDVPASAKQRVTTFTGTDNTRYIVAYIEPHHPKVALNGFTVGVYKMETMMNFPIVDNFKVKIDPRMPSMGNHGSPNNVDLSQSASDKLYYGKLSLTMTGYWKINLQLLNESNVILKGETITDLVPASSIYFEIEF